MPAQSESFYVDIERRYESTYWHGRWKWELRMGNEEQARLVSEPGICTSGNTWTLAGARWEARRAKRKVVHSRSGKRYLPREVVR